MPANLTEARLAANRLNAKKSTGPRTAEGKMKSRRNALKHGLTGAGIALPSEDAVAVEERFEGLREELAPQTIMGVYFAQQIALMTVRTQRAARQESAALASRVLHAEAAWDEDRAAEADHLMGWIGVEPVAYRRKLMATPEGCDRLIGGLRGLLEELARPVVEWDFNHSSKLEAYLGRRELDLPRSVGFNLGRAIIGDFSKLDPGTLPDSLNDDVARRSWACDRMEEHLKAEIDKLETHRASLDLDGLALDRAGSKERALFDPGKEATLARKYEAAAARALYRAFQEFRAVEATGEPSDDDVLLGLDEPVIDPPLPEPAIEAGDAVEIAAVGTVHEPRKSLRGNDLEQAVASFGTNGSGQTGRDSRAVQVAPQHPDQPLDRVQQERRRLG